jgi:hypothetical protein
MVPKVGKLVPCCETLGVVLVEVAVHWALILAGLFECCLWDIVTTLVSL